MGNWQGGWCNGIAPKRKKVFEKEGTDEGFRERGTEEGVEDDYEVKLTGDGIFLLLKH